MNKGKVLVSVWNNIFLALLSVVFITIVVIIDTKKYELFLHPVFFVPVLLFFVVSIIKVKMRDRGG